MGPSEVRLLLAKGGVPEGFPGTEALFRHASLLEFLEHFGAVTRLLREPEDLAWLLCRHLRKLRRQGAVYAEMRVSPAVWERRGLDPRRTLAFLCGQAGRTEIPFRLILDSVRHWDRETLARDLDLCLEFRRGGVVAMGLGGDEAAAPASAFRDLAAECRSRDLPVIPHAGEALGGEEVLSALEVFRPVRIGHGIRAADCPAALSACAEQRVHLEVCPTSNRSTGAYRGGISGACRRLVQAGICFSVNTDDPGLFGTTLNREVRWAMRALHLNGAGALGMQAAAARAALLTGSERRSLLAHFGTG